MELFTLGAGNGYTERDVREQARALTGFNNDWKRGPGHVNFRFDAKRHDQGQKQVFGKKGDFDWQDAVRLCLHHPKHPAFFVDKLWSYFVPTAPDAATRGSLEALYRKDFQIRPVVEAILRHPTRPRRPADGEAAGRLHRRPPARARPRRRHRRPGSWLVGDAGQRLFFPPNVAGWDDERWLDTATFRGRWEVANYAQHALRARPTSRLRRCRREPEALVEGALAFWGSPTIRPETRAALVGFARRRMGDANQSWKKTSLPLPDRERAAPARSPSPPTSRPVDAHGPLLQRLLPHRPVRRGRGRGRTRTAGDRAGHAGARGHRARPRAASSPAAPASRSPSTAARRSCRARSRRGSPQPPRPARSACSSRSSSTAAPTRSRCSSRAATRSTASSARGSRCPPGRPALRGGRPAALAPVARRRSRTLHGEGKVSVMPGDRLHHPDQSHFTSRHFWEVGATSEQLRTGWLGRYLDRVGSPDNPLQGLSLDWRLQPALATAKMPVASIDGARPLRLLDAQRLGRGRATACSTRSARSAPCRRAATAALEPGDRRSPASRRGCASSCCRSAEGRRARLHEPGRLPDRPTTRSRAASPASPRCSAPACRCASSR